MDSRLAAVEARVRRFADSGDHSRLMEPGAMDDARQLWQGSLRSAAGDPAKVPVGVVRSLAYFHWYRGQVRTDEEQERDVVTALVLFRMLLGRAAGQIPDEAQGPLLDYLASRGMYMFSAYQRTGQAADLDRAVSALQDAATVCAADDPGRPGILANLGLFLHARYQRNGDGADLDAAIDAGRQAAASAAAEYRTMTLVNLTGLLYSRYLAAGDGADLDAAVNAVYEAIDGLAAGGTDSAGALFDPGRRAPGPVPARRRSPGSRRRG